MGGEERGNGLYFPFSHSWGKVPDRADRGGAEI
jgi:hypothetical protein